MRISDWSSDVSSSDLYICSIHLRRRYTHPSLAITAMTTLKKPTIIFCNSILAVNQWKDQILKWSDVHPDRISDRKSVVKGKSVSVRVDLGGRRIIKKKKNINIKKCRKR